jgi:hypothetical protein
MSTGGIPYRWSRYVPPKRFWSPTRLHGVITRRYCLILYFWIVKRTMYRIALGRCCMCCSTDIVFRDAIGYCEYVICGTVMSLLLPCWLCGSGESPWVGRDISWAEWRNAQMSTECTQRVHLYNAPVPNTTSVCIHSQHLPHRLSVPLQWRPVMYIIHLCICLVVFIL